MVDNLVHQEAVVDLVKSFGAPLWWPQSGYLSLLLLRLLQWIQVAVSHRICLFFQKPCCWGGTGCHFTSGVATCLMELTRIWACAKRCSQWHLLYLWTCTDPQDYLFHCMAYLTEETLKRNKSSYKQAEYQRTYIKKMKNIAFLVLGMQNGCQKMGHCGMIGYHLYWCWPCIVMFN